MTSVSIVKTLAEIGERAALDYLFTLLDHSSKVAFGPGDDCAAVQIGNDYLLLTTDMINAKTHIPPKMTPNQLGWFIVAINLSDIAAKGGTPLGILLSYGLPRSTSKEFLGKLTKGANSCAIKFGTTILGGDLKESSAITLTGTAIGVVSAAHFMPRKGIQPGDIVAVTGDLGKASAGFHSLPVSPENNVAEKALFQPYPRLKEGQFLAKTKLVTSCMDISDGLSSSLYQLKKINHLGFEIYQEKLPISPLLKKVSHQIPIDVTQESLHFGGDYELLLTISPKNFTELQKSFDSSLAHITAIGLATKKTDIMLKNSDGATPLENKGYEHFLKNL